MKEFVLSILLFATCITQLKSQVTSVNYQLRYNDNSCRYECYMKVESGSASSYFDRILSNAGVSISTPISCGISIHDDYNPKKNNSTGGTGTPTTWDITQFNIHEGKRHSLIIPVTNPLVHFDNLVTGQEVLLFDFSLSYNLPDVEINENPTNISGSDYSNYITIGGPTEDYNGNLPIELPSLMAEFDGPSVIEEYKTTNVLPASGGNWSSNDESIVTVTNGGIVTGVSTGTAILTFNTAFDCSTSLEVEIIPSTSPVGDPSVCLSVEGNGQQGIVLPSVTEAQRIAITGPYTGLLLFQKDENVGFYYYNGTVWKRLADM